MANRELDHYQVRPGDTATRIAGRLVGAGARWVELRGVNPDRNWNRLYPGELLTLPEPWRRPRLVAAPRIGDVSNGMSLAEARERTPWLSAGFFTSLVAIARRYGIPPFHLLGVLYQESGVHPWANPNKRSGANGLIHWMPGTAPLGTSDARLVAMTAEEQLPLVDAWLSRWTRAMNGAPLRSAGLVYATVFAPARVTPSATEDTVIFAKTVECSDVPPPGRKNPTNKSDPYCANISLDHDRKGAILMRDLTRTIENRMREASFEKFRVRMSVEGGATPTGSSSSSDGDGEGWGTFVTPGGAGASRAELVAKGAFAVVCVVVAGAAVMQARGR